MTAPEDGLHFDLPIVEPPAQESATFEIRVPEPSVEVPVVEEPSESGAPGENGAAETNVGETTQETRAETGTPAAAESNGHNGGVWQVLSRLSAMAHGLVRKLVDTASR